jgi:hypothetical protein
MGGNIVTTKNYMMSVCDFDVIENHNGYLYDSIDETVRFKENHKVYGLGNISDWSRFKKIEWHYSTNGSKPLEGVLQIEQPNNLHNKKYYFVRNGNSMTKRYLN